MPGQIVVVAGKRPAGTLRVLASVSIVGAPRMDRADAVRALGADLAQLEDVLAGRAQDTHGPRTPSGLRVDQAAAVLSVLTGGRRVSVIDAPAGSQWWTYRGFTRRR